MTNENRDPLAESAEKTAAELNRNETGDARWPLSFIRRYDGGAAALYPNGAVKFYGFYLPDYYEPSRDPKKYVSGAGYPFVVLPTGEERALH